MFQAKAKSPEFHESLMWVTGTQIFEISPAPFKGAHKQKAGQEAEEFGPEPGNLIRDVGI